ncbi:hypothetical protein C8A01DRAFT_33575 [Parachaetomium inaequale]|uniref:Uncharacterized protein n=1 Tax=Parachaetomium inaequale TaxID=2588326 RepID=A0AAN6PJX4_9PEZI|nr:hypothetical protein C8A01DRAFT_33575 [Parachaetomium inaequale]
MTEKKNARTMLARSKTVAIRPNALARAPSRQPGPSRVPETAIKIFDLSRNYSFPPEDDANPREECPDKILEAIRRRLDAVRVDASAQGEAARDQFESREVDVDPNQPEISPDEGSTVSTLEETQLRVRILEGENRMLRDCLIECVSHNSRAYERDYGVAERDARPAHVEVLMDELTESRRQRSLLERRVEELETLVRQDRDIFQMMLGREPVADGQPDCKPIIRHIRTELEQHRVLDETIGPALTIRGVLTLKMLHHQRARAQTRPSGHGPVPNDLDTVLSMDEAVDLANQLDSNRSLLDHKSACIRDCSVCKKSRFLRMPPISSSSRQLQPLVLTSPLSSSAPLSEFNCSPTGQTACCKQRICDECYYPAIVANISTDWWRNLGANRWLTCPAPGCGAFLPVSHDTELRTILRACRDPEIFSHVRRFERASRLRAAVTAIKPSYEALLRAATFHAHLQQHGRLLDPVDYHGGDDDGTCEEDPLPKIELLPMSSPTNPSAPPLQVPIFTGLLRRPGGPPDSPGSPNSPSSASPSSPEEEDEGRECDTCHNRLRDLTTGTARSEAAWAAVIRDYPGDWAWMVRPFPAPAALRVCNKTHWLNTCRGCLGEYIVKEMKEMRESNAGEGGAEKRAIPCLECGHAYQWGEVRVIVGGEGVILREWELLCAGGWVSVEGAWT